MANIKINVGFNKETKSKGYRYKDLTLPVKFNYSGKDIQASLDIEAVKNGLRNLFTWKRGERILNPEFGMSLSQYLYEPITKATAISIGESIKLGIGKWEPRVKLDSIQVIPNTDENQYNVTIKYSVPTLPYNGTLSFMTDLVKNS